VKEVMMITSKIIEKQREEKLLTPVKPFHMIAANSTDSMVAHLLSSIVEMRKLENLNHSL
jgi:hypothetical protein